MSSMKIKRKVLLFILFAVCLPVMAACGIEKEREDNESIRENEIKEPETVRGDAELPDIEESEILDWVEETIRHMTLEEKAAQLFYVTPEALTGVDKVVRAGNTTKESLRRYPVGGIVYFASNIESREQVQQMLEGSKRYMTENDGIPLFTGVDEEGGSVARVASGGISGVPKIEDMSKIGASKDYEKALETGQVIGKYLNELGFNMDFAPVADVLTNPANTVVKKRSFGSEKEVVSEMVQQELTGMHQSGILGVIKHFPGHGATAGDTHQGYAYIEKTLEELLGNELVPFCEAIQNGVQVIMVGHISVPEITGTDEPSSLSYQVITEILRENLGFQGIVITDAMNMGAISQKYSSAEAAVKVIQAGGDMILMPADFKSAYQGILNAVYNGEITEERLDESVRRILKVKEKLLEESR